jgi:hypothetical protein
MLLIDTGLDTDNPKPPGPPPTFHRPPSPPIPVIFPELFKVTPPGQDPLMVKPGVPVLVAYAYTPLLIFATTALVPPQPAATTKLRKLPLAVLEVIV